MHQVEVGGGKAGRSCGVNCATTRRFEDASVQAQTVSPTHDRILPSKTIVCATKSIFRARVRVGSAMDAFLRITKCRMSCILEKWQISVLGGTVDKRHHRQRLVIMTPSSCKRMPFERRLIFTRSAQKSNFLWRRVRSHLGVYSSCCCHCTDLLMPFWTVGRLGWVA